VGSISNMGDGIESVEASSADARVAQTSKRAYLDAGYHSQTTVDSTHAISTGKGTTRMIELLNVYPDNSPIHQRATLPQTAREAGITTTPTRSTTTLQPKRINTDSEKSVDDEYEPVQIEVNISFVNVVQIDCLGTKLYHSFK
jgi:hypothetical protein